MKGWRVIAEQESRDLWVNGRGPALLFGYGVLLSVIAYLAASNQVLDYMAQRDAVNLAMQVSLAVGVLVALIVSADAISGERERGTLESLLLAPVDRRAIIVGKLTAALSLWFAALAVSVPYLWVLSRGTGLLGQALALSLVVGTLLAVALAALGLLLSGLAGSNKVSLSAGLLLLLALAAPTQLPITSSQSPIADLLIRLNPMGAGLHFVTGRIVGGLGWTPDLSYLASPLLAAVLAVTALITAGPRLVRLTAGVGGE